MTEQRVNEKDSNQSVSKLAICHIEMCMQQFKPRKHTHPHTCNVLNARINNYLWIKSVNYVCASYAAHIIYKLYRLRATHVTALTNSTLSWNI